jgi:ribosomal protein S18 acetylase RimI-like enzyme
MVTLRPALPSDPAAVALLDQYFAARAEAFPAASGQYRRPSVVAAEFVPPQGVFLLVEGENLAGEPADVGCGGIRTVEAGPRGERREVKHVWIQPHARRTGAGRALMLELERVAHAQGARELVLDTHDTQTAAGALYASLGFTRIDPFNDNPNATTWMAKLLYDD